MIPKNEEVQHYLELKTGIKNITEFNFALLNGRYEEAQNYLQTINDNKIAFIEPPEGADNWLAKKEKKILEAKSTRIFSV